MLQSSAVMSRAKTLFGTTRLVELIAIFVRKKRNVVFPSSKMTRFSTQYSLDAVEWKSTLLGVILGITSLEWKSAFKIVESTPSSGLNHSFESGFH